MKKGFRFAVVVFLLITLIPVSALAVNSRSIIVNPSLEITNNVASCQIFVSAEHNDSISAVIKLYKGTICVQQWTRTSTSYLNFRETKDNCTYGEYTLKVDLKINNVKWDSISIDYSYT